MDTTRERRGAMRIILWGIIPGVILIAVWLAGRYAYRNLHPADETYLQKAFAAGFTEKQMTRSDGSVINYGEGPDNGPPIFLIHGQGVSWEDYAAVLPGLSERFHVFAADCFGHGESSHDPGLYTLEGNGEALAEFLRDTVGEPAYISGHSSGGVLTAYLAASAPELTRGIVLEDPPLFRVTPEEMQTGAGAFAWKDGFEIIHSFLNQSEEKDYVVYYYQNSYIMGLFGGLREKVAERIADFRSEHPGEMPKLFYLPYSMLRLMSFADTYDVRFGEAFYDGTWMGKIDQETMLHAICCKAIYLKAATNYGKDGVLYAANSDEDAKRVGVAIENSETIVIKSGHDIHYEQPEAFIAACEKLLA